MLPSQLRALVFRESTFVFRVPDRARASSSSTLSASAPAFVPGASTEETTETVSVPAAAVGRIIGRGGAKLADLRVRTRCAIDVAAPPKKAVDAPDAVVTLRGAPEQVERAKAAIAALVSTVTPEFTHYVSIPIVAAEKTQAQLDALHALCNSNSIQGLDASILVAAPKLHITLFLMRITAPEQLQAAKDALARSARKVYDALGTRTLLLDLAGLDIMRGTAQDAHVVYAGVREATAGSENARLDALRKCVLAEFVAAGLVTESDAAGECKYHVTLVNTKYRAGKRPPGNAGFDATRVLAEFGAADFGRVRAGHVSLMARANAAPDKGTHVVSQISLP